MARSTALDKSLTPEQRRLRAQLGAHSLHAKVEHPAEHTRPAREAFLSKFADQVDPDGGVRERIAGLWAAGRDAEAERAEDDFERHVAHARSAYFVRLAYASSRARAARRLARDEAAS